MPSFGRNTTTKALSYVLANMYPGAFASYQGMVFRVTGPGAGALRGITEDRERTRQVVRDLADASGLTLEDKLRAKLNRELAAKGAGSVTRKAIQVVVPGKVDLRLEDEALDYLYCTNPDCGRVDTVSAIVKYRGRANLSKCSRCHSPLGQAPVWVAVKKGVMGGSGRSFSPRGLPASSNEDMIRSMGYRQALCPMLEYRGAGQKSGCKHPGSSDGTCPANLHERMGSIKITDSNRPIDSLRRFKPDCPNKLDVDFVEFERLYSTPTYWFRMDFPRESFTSSLRVSAAQEAVLPPGTPAAPLLEEVNQQLEDVKAAKFNSDLVDLSGTRFAEIRVLDVTYGYAVGSRNYGFYRYYVGVASNEVPGRLTKTHGFVLSLKPEFFDRLAALSGTEGGPWSGKPIEDLAEIALHSLKHALLVLAPMFTGFEPDKFYGAFDLDVSKRVARVYAYDAEEGGNGGFATILRAGGRFTEMLSLVVKRLECPLRDCRYGCKQCLFIKNCGAVNRGLNRHLLRELNILL
jgi:hypothetical protein